MPILINNFGDCTGDTLGTGTRSCDIKSFGDVTGSVLFNKGFSLTLASDSLAEATYKNLIKGFKVFPLLGIYDFAQNTPENEKNTSALGVMTEIRAGKPQFSFNFDKGGCFHKALYDKRGKSRWDLGIVFDRGVLLALNIAKTKISGFDMGMFSVETFKLLQGTDPQMSTAMIQLLNAEEFNTRFVFLTWEELGYDWNDTDGVVETTLTYPSPPAAGTTFSVKVSSACNVDDIILDLDEVASWELGGEQTSSTTISAIVFNSTTNAYDFTVTPTMIVTDTIQPKLVSAGGYSVAEDTLGNLFKGQAPLATL